MIALNRPPRILYVAVNPPRDTFAGALVMHRHLSRLAGRFEYAVAHTSADIAQPGETVIPVRHWVERLRFTRFGGLAAGVDFIHGLSIDRGALLAAIRRYRPDVILVMAEGPLATATRRAAAACKIPMVSIFHDWCTAWLDIAPALQRRSDRELTRLAADSKTVFCVTDALREKLGSPAHARVLLPIPDSSVPPPPNGASGFHAVYAGGFSYFQREEMSTLLAELQRRGQCSQLQVYAPSPPVPDPLYEALRTAGVYQGFKEKRGDLDQALANADTLLVVFPFAARFASFTRYSFPSKLVEYARFGRPILIWAPADSACVRWARRSGAANVVTEPVAAAVATELSRLAADPARRLRYGAAARACAMDEFCPTRLQAMFEAGLHDAIKVQFPP